MTCVAPTPRTNPIQLSIFSAAVAQAFRNANDAADANSNGVLDVTEFIAAVKRYVVGKSAGQQTPWVARNRMIGDFALY